MSEGEIIILVANIIAGVGTFLFTISSVFRSKKKILATQCVYHLGFAVVADIMLKGWVGLFQEVMSGVRNLFVIFNKNTRIVNIIIIIFAVFLSAFGIYIEALGLHLGPINIEGKSKSFSEFMAMGGWMSFLPIVANLQYSVVVLKVKHPIILRSSLLFSAICWSTYLFSINSYLSASLNLLSLAINTYQMIAYIIILRKQGVRLIDDIKGTGEVEVSVIKNEAEKNNEVEVVNEVNEKPLN